MLLERTNVRSLRALRDRGRTVRGDGRRPLVHLAHVGRPGAGPVDHARRRPRAAGEAAVRSRSRPGRPGRDRARPRGAPCRARRRDATGSPGAGIGVTAAMPSPLRGADGNVEFLFHARKGVPPSTPTRSTPRWPKPRGRRSVTASVASEPRAARSAGSERRRRDSRTVGLVPHRDRARRGRSPPTSWSGSRRTASRCASRSRTRRGLETRRGAGRGVRRRPRRRDLARRRRHDAAHRRPRLRGRRPGARRERRPDGLPHRGRAGRLSTPRSTGCSPASTRSPSGWCCRSTVESAGPAAGRWCALNEAVLEKAHPGGLARLDVAINGTFFTHVRGRRRDRRHADRVHRVLVLGARADRVAAHCAACCSRRCRRTCCSTARSCSRPRRTLRVRRERRPAASCSPLDGRELGELDARRRRARAPAARARRASSPSGPATSTRS